MSKFAEAKGYAPYWPVLSGVVRFALGKATCRWCGALHGETHPTEGYVVWLATAHLVDRAPLADRLDNLAPLCQTCHLRHDHPERVRAGPRQKARRDRVRATKRQKARLFAQAKARVDRAAALVDEVREALAEAASVFPKRRLSFRRET